MPNIVYEWEMTLKNWEGTVIVKIICIMGSNGPFKGFLLKLRKNLKGVAVMAAAPRALHTSCP